MESIGTLASGIAQRLQLMSANFADEYLRRAESATAEDSESNAKRGAV